MTLTIAIRSAAVPAWAALQAALRAAGPVPCTADPDAWTSDDAEVRAYAARACRGCPVLEACRAFAAANQEAHGVWAGVDRGDRAAVRSLNRKERTA